MDRRSRNCSSVWLVFLICASGVLIGALFFRGENCVSCPLVVCETVELEKSVARMQSHLLEAQQDYRRCVLSHPVAIQSSVRSGKAAPLLADKELGARRAELLQQLQGARLVPRGSIDVAFVFINGSDPAWRFARNAMSEQGAVLPQHSDNGGLLFALRSLCKYGAASLDIRVIHIVTVFGQKPVWLRSFSVSGLPEVRLVELGDAVTIESTAHLLNMIPDLQENFLLWSDRSMLGKSAERSDFWALDGGWGPRFYLDEFANRHYETDCLLDRVLGSSVSSDCKRRVAVAAYRPLPVSLSALRILLKNNFVQDSQKFDFHHLYIHWMIEHGLAGSVGEHDDALVVRISHNSQIQMQQVLRNSYLHTLVCFDDHGHGTRLPMLEDLMSQRWSTKSGWEQ
jgi:hypothetical protein